MNYSYRPELKYFWPLTLPEYIRATPPFPHSPCSILSLGKAKPQVDVARRVDLRKSVTLGVSARRPHLVRLSLFGVSLVLVPTRPTLALVLSVPSHYYPKSRSYSLGPIARAFAINSCTALLGLLTRHYTAPSPLNHPFGLRLSVTLLELEPPMPRDLDTPRFYDPCPCSPPPPPLTFRDLVFVYFLHLFCIPSVTKLTYAQHSTYNGVHPSRAQSQ